MTGNEGAGSPAVEMQRGTGGWSSLRAMEKTALPHSGCGGVIQRSGEGQSGSWRGWPLGWERVA